MKHFNTNFNYRDEQAQNKRTGLRLRRALRSGRALDSFNSNHFLGLAPLQCRYSGSYQLPRFTSRSLRPHHDDPNDLLRWLLLRMCIYYLAIEL